MHRYFGGAAIVVTLVLGACGGGNPADSPAANAANASATAEGTPPTAAAAVDPCSLATPAEVGQVIGEEVVAAKASGTTCRYETADAQASTVEVEVKSGGAAEMDTMRKTNEVLSGIGKAASAQGGAGRDVDAMLQDAGGRPKLGDDALFSANQLLSVRKGDTYISVQPPIMRSRISGGNPLLSSDDKKKVAVAIAEKMVAKLP